MHDVGCCTKFSVWRPPAGNVNNFAHRQVEIKSWRGFLLLVVAVLPLEATHAMPCSVEVFARRLQQLMGPSRIGRGRDVYATGTVEGAVCR